MNFSFLQKFGQMKYYMGVKRLPLKRKKKLYYFIETEIYSDKILYWGEETSTEEKEETEQPIEEPISEEEAEAIMIVSLSFSK